MATWITHLRLAEKFQTSFGEKDFDYFLIGSIAPDSGTLVDPVKQIYDPPSEVSHFRDKSRPRWHSMNMRFYNLYYKTTESRSQRAFMLGYFYHLILDDLWGHYLYHPYRKLREKEILENPRYIWENKENWASSDFYFLKKNPHWAIWSRYSRLSFNREWLNFYKAAQIEGKLRYLRTYYEKGRDDLVLDPFMTPARIDMLIDLAALWISRAMEIIGRGKAEGCETVMELLEENFAGFRYHRGDLEGDHQALSRSGGLS